jgi:hypothetical protein
MSFGDISERMYFKTIDTGEVVTIARFQLSEDMQLNYMRVLLFKKAMTITTEQMRISVLSSNSSATPIATSDWSDLADIDGISAGNWIGFLRFDFNGEFLDASSEYVIQIEAANYTRSGDISYLSLSLDWPNQINDHAVPSDPAIGVEIYGTC